MRDYFVSYFEVRRVYDARCMLTEYDKFVRYVHYIYDNIERFFVLRVTVESGTESKKYL